MATCSECTFLDLGKEFESWDCKYWCEEHNEWRYANAAECYRFCRAYNRSSAVANSYYKRSQESQSSQNSSCYITTIVCDILGQPDNAIVLQKLRAFRDNVLQKDKKYLSLLITYDMIGPIIAYKLNQDQNKKAIATNLYNLGLTKVVDLIDKEETEKAVSLYTNMTQLLIDGYHIENPGYNTIIIEDVPTSQLGHGKQYVKRNA